MKKKNVIWVVVWCAALICCLFGVSKLMERQDSHLKYDVFFAENEKTQQFDVFLMGTSHVFDGVYPKPIWRDHGIACYYLANSSECLELTEWTLRLALQYHKPKVALVDVYYVDRSLQDTWAHTYRHLFLDAMPLNLLKIRSVTETFPKNEWAEFIVPFSLYHGRWEEMLAGTTKLTMNAVPCMMGAEMRLRTIPAEPWSRTTEMNTENMPGKDALRRIAALCREEGIELVLTAVPSAMTQAEQRNVNSVALIAEELGVPFINMLDMPELYDFETDLYDGVSHMNPDGALKTTAYLGNWLTEHFDFADKRQDPAYADWNTRLEEYEAYYASTWGSMTTEDKLNAAGDGGAEQ